MVEIFLLALLILTFLKVRVENGIIILLFLLPFHAFIKNALSYYLYQGFIFSYWKEIAIIIMLSKTLLIRKKLSVDRNLLAFILIFMLIVSFYFIIAPEIKPAISPLRNHIFTILLFLLFSNFIVREGFIQKSLKILIISFLASYILGFVQLYFLKIPLGYLMNRIEYISPGGYIVYTTNSARILGIERMAGIIGGPNGFGLFCAISLLYIYIHRYTFLKRFFRKKSLRVMTLVFILGFFSLILSFSRAALGIFFVAVFLLNVLSLKRNSLIYLTIPAFLFVVILIAAPRGSTIHNVFNKTFSGKEPSASDRLNQFTLGLEKLQKEPFGHGLGTANNQYPELKQFFVESAFLNIIYEIGIVGFLLLTLIYLTIILLTLSNFRQNPYAALSFSIALTTYLASFFTVNTYDMPYVLFSWGIIGLGLNKDIRYQLQIRK